MNLNNVLVLGLGKVGILVANLLHDSGFTVTGADSVKRSGLPFATKTMDISKPKELNSLLKDADAVVSCLPFFLNKDVSTIVAKAGLHYFDLTEDVPTTNHIRKLAKTSKGLLAPQCGLAPGFIGIVGANLAKDFDTLRSIELKVGALPKHPRGKLGYAFNWSPEGIINEYINDCEVIRMGQRQMVPALEGYEIVSVSGMQFEAATTSGGLGTMCETYDGKVQELSYKTIRYLGHFEQIKFLFQELRMQEDRALLGKIMRNALPASSEDFVFVHAAVEGWKDGVLARAEFVRAYSQMKLNDGKVWPAICWTTAASVAAVVEMVRDGTLPNKGFLKQEEIPLEKFLKTQNGSYYVTGEKL
ncbi:MAG TPA: saccharopine dehydrogenase C-terminal domain-containing protein [Candidatus Pristimantibacillus sp.]|nr:saccharopine dehydrogenase C-terminal domain-containing protein [Candidatus Pristimantibacillus sp.]